MKSRVQVAAHMIAMDIGAIASVVVGAESPTAGRRFVLQEVVWVTEKKRREAVAEQCRSHQCLAGARRDVFGQPGGIRRRLNTLLTGLGIV